VEADTAVDEMNRKRNIQKEDFFVFAKAAVGTIVRSNDFLRTCPLLLAKDIIFIKTNKFCIFKWF
jgi:hypothetical protein